ncbi:winged helix DNA-binding domain-containing protein [Agromyces sp. Marseille-P2726]|uniref:winged helix DNA-binding domain-containing protein n=1 Tax=Agromyces sp. Marseille-P2726 TaxID=2709132 RepID=UPI00156FDBA4|nr:winged helix DNA-binding domain-containing protein [Agromyces sp. Marseille-P2726]
MTTDAAGVDAETIAVRAARLAAHALDGGLPTPSDVVERLVCVQAQDLAAAKWVLGARVPSSTEETIESAIDQRALLRSWPMRGTLHFVAPAMLRPILRLTSARLRQRAAKTRRDEGIDDEAHAAARRVAVRMLEGGRAATREELQAAWSAAGISTAGQRGYHLIWLLANEGVLCCGPVETRARQRFVLLDEWSPRGSDEPGDVDEVLARLFTGYARGHGPVSIRDFAWWTGLTLAQARTAVTAARDAVAPYDGDRYVAAEAPPVLGSDSAARLALAPFDEYFLGYADRTAFCSPDDAPRVVPGRNGMFLPILVHDGEVVATWRRSAPRRGAVPIEVRPFRDGLPVEEFRPAFDRWAAFWSTQVGDLTLQASE